MYLRKNGREFRYAAIDPHCKQIARCICAYGRAHVFGPSTNCCCGWSICWEEFSARKLCRQVSLAFTVTMMVIFLHRYNIFTKLKSFLFLQYIVPVYPIGYRAVCKFFTSKSFLTTSFAKKLKYLEL